MTQFKIGDVIDGEVTGIQNYGVFVRLSQEEQGLIHISECRHGYVRNFDEYFEIGQKLKVVIVDIDEYTQKISLSIRALNKLNLPPFPARIKRRKKRYTPNIGFASVEKQLPEWIDEAMHNIEIDKYHQHVE